MSGMSRIVTSCLEESAGIPEEILVENEETCVRIPDVGETSALRIGDSVAIALYEALRQNGFEAMAMGRKSSSASVE